MTSFVVKCHQANLVYVSLMAFEFDAKFIKKKPVYSHCWLIIVERLAKREYSEPQKC